MSPFVQRGDIIKAWLGYINKNKIDFYTGSGTET